MMYQKRTKLIWTVLEMVDFDFLRENIDFTNVSPVSSLNEIEELCAKAIKYYVKTIYIQPVFLSYAKNKLKGEVDIGTTGGFPFGNIPVKIKLSEIEYAGRNGARWIDVCLNISNVKSNKWDKVKQEICKLKAKSSQESIGLKIIIEVPFLTFSEIEKIVHIAEEEKIEFLKTASGIRNKVTLDQLKLIKPLLRFCKIKVSGGVSNLKEAEEFFENGADIVGSSKGFDILEESLNG